MKSVEYESSESSLVPNTTELTQLSHHDSSVRFSLQLDPIHGTKAGYSKIAMKLAEKVEADLVPKAKKIVQRKRAASPEVSGASGSGNTFSRNVCGRGGSEPGYNFVPGSHPNQRGGWLPGFTRGDSRGGG
jgi:hypothetical protein